MYNSMIHYLYIALYSLHRKSSLLPSPFTQPPHSDPTKKMIALFTFKRMTFLWKLSLVLYKHLQEFIIKKECSYIQVADAGERGLTWCPKQVTLLNPDSRVGETDFSAKSEQNVWIPRGVKVWRHHNTLPQGLSTRPNKISLLAGQL